VNTQLRFQRHELKYYLPEEMYPKLIRQIRPYMTLDPDLGRNGEKSYLVRSLYLDTDDLKSYNEKLAGAYYREKFRIRAYNHERSTVFLEIKQKYSNIVVKDRACVQANELPSLLDRYGGYRLNGEKGKTESEVIMRFLSLIPVLQLRPMLLVAYEREAYTGVFDETARLTLDRNLCYLPGRACDIFYSGEDWFPVKHQCILELKFNHILPFFFKNIIKRLNLWAQAISKYCLCIERCDPVLPR
jgi:SPX domain protein involved in polyphosphate accumulation